MEKSHRSATSAGNNTLTLYTESSINLHLKLGTRSTAQLFYLNLTIAVQSGTQSDIDKLESVQKFTGKIVTKQWKAEYPNLLAYLNWQSLSSRRRNQKLKVCFSILINLSIISPNVFAPYPHPSPRHPHNQTLFKPFVALLINTPFLLANLELPSPTCMLTSIRSHRVLKKKQFNQTAVRVHCSRRHNYVVINCNVLHQSLPLHIRLTFFIKTQHTT